MSDEWKRATDEAKRASMANFRMRAEKTKNPLYNWLAICQAVGLGEPIPDWCLDYLSECSAEIYVLMTQVTAADFPMSMHASDGSRIAIELEPQQAAAKIAEALQIVVPARSYNAFKHFRDDEQKIQDAALVGQAEMRRHYRLEKLDDSLSKEGKRFGPQSFYDRIYGTVEEAEVAPERALEAIQKRRNLAHLRSAKARVKAGRALLNHNKMPPSGG
jgi:hypothetical protein